MVAPISVATNAAVDAAFISGVAVAIITKSISLGLTFDFANKSLPARIAIYEEPLPSPFRILLSCIPVLVNIQSLVVSTIPSRILLVKTYSGKYFPTAVIAAVIFFINCFIL